MSTLTAIENAVIAWVAAAGVAGGIPLAASSVILADQGGPRPDHAYVTVKVITHDTTVHTDELVVDEDALQRVRGLRTGTVSLNAYGAGAEAWLERANLKLRSPSVMDLLETAGLTLRPEGGIRNLTGLRDTAAEARFQRDYFVDYGLVESDDDAEAGVELGTVIHTDEFRDDALDAGTAADRIETVTIEVS